MPLLWLCWWDVCHTSEAGLAAGRGRGGQREQSLNPVAVTDVSSYVHSVCEFPQTCLG